MFVKDLTYRETKRIINFNGFELITLTNLNFT